MWTSEALHVSELADFTGHMLTSPARPGPMVFQNYTAQRERSGVTLLFIYEMKMF